ncbi:MAG: hypothetical protein RLZZ142_1807 [Verrucomicrobiota bacterium]
MDTPPPASAQESFIRELTLNQSVLRGICQSALGNPEDAQEALQRTNVVLWKKSGDWDPGTPFVRWAVTVARYVVLGMIRDRQRERLVFESDVEEVMLEEAAEEVEGFEERREALRRCLARLREAHREILSAHYVRGCSVREVAEARNMGVSAVKVLMLRLRQTLGECIQRQIGGAATRAVR